MERSIPVGIHMFPSFHTDSIHANQDMFFPQLRDEILKSDILKPWNLNFLGFGM